MKASEKMTPVSCFYSYAHCGGSNYSERFFHELGGEFFLCFAPTSVQLVAALVACWLIAARKHVHLKAAQRPGSARQPGGNNPKLIRGQ